MRMVEVGDANQPEVSAIALHAGLNLNFLSLVE